MRNSDTYKGFVYQKKCAFLLLLNELADETGVIAFRMEHPKGDDFDLVYQNGIRIYQTKEVANPNMPEFLAKMWRRYTENMRPGEHRDITLGFIFSMDHSTDEYFASLSANKITPALMCIKDKTDKDGNRIVNVSSDAEWHQFLKPITVEIRPDLQVEAELNRAISYMFIDYGLPKSDRKSMYFEFLGRLDEIMACGKQVPEKEVREIIHAWFVRYSLYHPLIKNAVLAASQQRFSELMQYKPPESPIAADGTLP